MKRGLFAFMERTVQRAASIFCFIGLKLLHQIGAKGGTTDDGKVSLRQKVAGTPQPWYNRPEVAHDDYSFLLLLLLL
uniref:Putative secreted peptide n=1 Tax=Anopheles braziliensis TaxID=58242 RepID=A0A2M3ZME9_9DIPT